MTRIPILMRTLVIFCSILFKHSLGVDADWLND